MRARPATALLLFALALPAGAATRLDDSLSPRQRVEIVPRWVSERVQGPVSDDQLNALVAEVPRFEVRLNTAKYVGQEAEIYLRLPVAIVGLQSPAGLRLEWRTRGFFAPGAVRPGDRLLLFRGKVTQPVMGDTFDFLLHFDGRYIQRGLQFDPIYEIEILR
jgi:hypothetical protein